LKGRFLPLSVFSGADELKIFLHEFNKDY
jgi:hypothetical protein